MSDTPLALISDRQFVAALKFDSSSIDELSACVARSLRAEGAVKRVKALEMQKVAHLPLAAQEREAFASDAWHEAMLEEAAAAAALEQVKAARAHARLTIEIWRSMEGSYRTISRFP
jgi:hypothetical protein